MTRLYGAGLGTGCCVLRTAMDAPAAGFEVVRLRNAIAAANVHPGDNGSAPARMRELGAGLIDSVLRGGLASTPPGPS